MAPTRMKLRVRRRDNAAVGAGEGQPEEEEERNRESVGRSSRRKNTNNASTAPAAAPSSSSSPPTSSASASARAVVASEDASPDSKCPICLDRFNNLAYLDRCLHRFCFPCIQEWSHNKPECPLCKQPFSSILHSVRAENDFKEYTLRPAPANSSVAATVAMVAAMASAARSDHQMRLMLQMHRLEHGEETTTRRRRRERGGRGARSRRAGERTGVLECYLDPHSLPHPPLHPPVLPVGTDDSDEGENPAQQSLRGDLDERGVIFEGLTGLGGAVAPVAPHDQASRRLMTRLAARQRLQREGGTVRRLREREMVAFRRALYRCGIRVRGVAGVNGNQGQQQRDITADSFRQNPAHLSRLRPWLERELTVLYGAHRVLVHMVQRIIMARLARHGLEDTPTVEEELRPFLLARTDHFLHELVSFARSPLTLENYDLQAVYEPPAPGEQLAVSSSSESSSVIAISEGEEEEGQERGRSEERLQGRLVGVHNDDIQSGSCLSLSAWDDETPGPSYSTAEPSCSLASLSFSPVLQEASIKEGGEKQEEGEAEEECLIVGYKKPIAERTPELVQLSSDTEEDEEKKKEEEKVEETLPTLPSTAPPPSYLPTVPPSTSSAYRDEQDDKQKDKGGQPEGRSSRARSWSGSSGRSHESVFTPSPSERQRESWRDHKSGSEAAREKRRRRKRRRGQERSSEWLRKTGTLYNPNRSIYPAMMRRLSRSPSPFHSSMDSGSPLPPSPPDSSWEYNCCPLTSSVSSPSHSSSSLLSSSPQPSLPPQTPPTPSLSPSNTHHGEKPGGKRKYKSRHLDSNDKDPTWRPSSSHRREKKRKRVEKERRKRRGRDGGRRREKHRRGAHRPSGDYCGESRKCREDRSPSVEIIYEGTITSDATQPPACKRRRKRHRKTQHTSSPVIITLDSDSSHNDVNNKQINSSSSSPLSSQQTVDFSDLPPLPLVHSAGVGGALDPDIGELPVDILDRGSDGSETEPAGQSEAAGPIIIDNRDNSDCEVDVENVEGSVSVSGCNNADKLQSSNIPEPLADTKACTSDNHRGTASADGSPEPVGKNVAELAAMDVHKRDSEVLTSDSHLLATVLNDLKGINAPVCDFPFNFESSCSPETRKRRFRNPCEVSQAQSRQDAWLAERKLPSPDLPEERQSNSVRDQCRTTVPPHPPLEEPIANRVREEDRGVPPLLKQASPVQLDNRNSPPPLKLKDGQTLDISPISSVNVHPPLISDADSVNSSIGHSLNLTVCPTDLHLAPELPKNNQVILPITALKRHLMDRHFTSTLALRKELVSTSSISTQPTDSPSCSKVGALTASIHSGHKPPIDSHSSPVLENSSTSADSLPNSDFYSSQLLSSHESTNKISSGPRSSSIDLHPVNLSAIDFHSAESGWSTEKSAQAHSTSGGCKNKTFGQNTCRVLPIDLHPCSSVSAEDALAGSDVFSGVNSNNISPLVSASSTDSRTQNPNLLIDSHLSSEKDIFLEKLKVGSAPSSSLSPTDMHSRSCKYVVDQSSCAAPETLINSKESLAVNHEDTSPHGVPPAVDLHCTSHAPFGNQLNFINTTTDRHFNHTALSSSSTEHTITYHTSQRKCATQSKPTVESHSKLHLITDSDSKPHNSFDLSSTPQLPSDTYSKHSLPIDSQHESQPTIDLHPQNSQKDFKLHTTNHITSFPRPVENQWNSNSSVDVHSDSQSPIDEPQLSQQRLEHTRSAT
ncbi:uncharacterized protein LOC113168212 isoform X2 [Anabas testudineus]|uniref:uncharacterized protein LOC113168212 isoform X2 n=1 Tax=Anabas testudineus TaxID=64144 RepID=UPI000E45818B|nr:uncharacterized protein LOC113168212 isoform X2 [Anabas testudineus]